MTKHEITEPFGGVAVIAGWITGAVAVTIAFVFVGLFKISKKLYRKYREGGKSGNGHAAYCTCVECHRSRLQK